MNYWQIDPETGELLDGPIAPRFDARSNEFLYPRGAVLVTPPTPQNGKVIVWNGEQWEHVEDHRGTEWWDEDGNQVIITELGPLPEGLSKDPPPPPTESLVVTKRQLLLALYMEHQIQESDIEAVLQENTLALIDFKASTQIERAYPLVDQLGYIFNLDKKDIDNVFQIAYNIQNPYSNEQPDQS